LTDKRAMQRTCWGVCGQGVPPSISCNMETLIHVECALAAA